jgi:hypothetical protein
MAKRQLKNPGRFHMPHLGQIFFLGTYFKKWEARVPTEESCWVRTKALRGGRWPFLFGRHRRLTETGLYHGYYLVVGHGYDAEPEDRFVWLGQEADFRAIWESDTKMMPVKFDFQSAA